MGQAWLVFYIVFYHAILMCSLGLLLSAPVVLPVSSLISTVSSLQFVDHSALSIWTFVFAEKNLSHHISSFNESTGFGLLKASPVEFVKYPFVVVDL